LILNAFEYNHLLESGDRFLLSVIHVPPISSLVLQYC